MPSNHWPTDVRAAWRAARELADEVAPDRTVREAFRALEAECLRGPEAHTDKLRHFVGAIYDGLAYGNWPKGSASHD